MTDVHDVMSFPPLPPSPAEVGDLILQTREHVQALGWGNREQLYTASQVRALLSECAIMSAARERERHADALRCALEYRDAAVAAERARCCRVVVVQCDDARLDVARRTILAIREGDDYHGDVDRDGLLRA